MSHRLVSLLVACGLLGALVAVASADGARGHTCTRVQVLVPTSTTIGDASCTFEPTGSHGDHSNCLQTHTEVGSVTTCEDL